LISDEGKKTFEKIVTRMKKGSQQAMKAPVTMANVLAALRSLLASSETCFFLLSLPALSASAF